MLSGLPGLVLQAPCTAVLLRPIEQELGATIGIGKRQLTFKMGPTLCANKLGTCPVKAVCNHALWSVGTTAPQVWCHRDDPSRVIMMTFIMCHLL